MKTKKQFVFMILTCWLLVQFSLKGIDVNSYTESDIVYLKDRIADIESLNLTAFNKWYVDINSKSNIGNKEFPFSKIQTAIDIASDNDTIIVLPGEYIENLVIYKNITIVSTFILDGDTSKIDHTIISGNSLLGTIQTNEQISLIGFTVKNARGVMNLEGNSSNSLISNCIFSDSRIYCIRLSEVDNIEIRNCKISNSSSAIVSKHSSFLINACMIYNNQNVFTFDSGSLDNKKYIKIVNSCVFNHNSIFNSPISHLNLTILNSNFINNVFNGELYNYLYGIRFGDGTNFIAKNSIFLSECPQFFIGDFTGDYSFNIDYSIISNGVKSFVFNDSTRSLSLGLNNIGLYQMDIKQMINQLFNASDDSYILLNDFSPAIGTGLLLDSVEFDIYGNTRINQFNENPDIGAYESGLSKPNPYPAAINLVIDESEFEVNLKWDYSEYFKPIVDYFEIWKAISDSTLVLLDTTSIYQYTDKDIIPGLKYDYSIRMKSQLERENLFTDTISILVEDLNPNTPLDLKVERIGFNSNKIQWTAFNQPDINHYKISRAVSGDSVRIMLNEVYTDSVFVDALDIKDLVTYEYSVFAVDNGGHISEPSIITIRSGDSTAPDTVRNLTAEAVPDKITLSWNENNEKDLWKYNIYRKSGDSLFQKIDVVQADVSVFVDATITNQIVYSYAVSAVDSTDNTQWDPSYEGALSNVIVAMSPDKYPPSIPQISEYTSSNKRVRITWHPQSESDLKGFRIYRSDNNEQFNMLDSVPGTVSVYEDTNVLNFNKYYYYVCAVDTNLNESARSPIIIGEPVNISPAIIQLADTVLHNRPLYMNGVEFTLAGSVDPDGQIEDYQWYINDNFQLNGMTAVLHLTQGTNTVKAVIIDNDGGKDSTQFQVSINSGYYKFDNIDNQNAGITVIGKEYIFNPEADGKMQILNSRFEKVFDVSIVGDINSVSSVSLDTMMYLASSTRAIYCFNKIGVPQWSLPLGGDLKATPTIDMSRDRIYVGVSNNNIFGIDRTLGRVVWSYRTDSPISQPGVVIGDNYLLIMTDNGKSHIFDLTKSPVNDILSPALTLNLNSIITTAPAIDREGNLYVSTSEGELIKFFFREASMTGEIMWKTNTNSSFETSPVIGSDGTVYIGSSDAVLRAFEGSTGIVKWALNLEDAISSTITISEVGTLYVGTEKGYMYAVSDEGSVLWCYDAKSAISNATAYIDDNLLFTNQFGELFKVYDGVLFKTTAPQYEKALTISKAPQWGTYQGNTRRSGVQSEAFVNTGLNPISLSKQISVSPMPFKNSVKLSLDLQNESRIVVQIFNMFGSVIYTNDLGILSSGESFKIIYTSNWSPGVYLFKVLVGNKIYSWTLIRE